jgi:hypothetical protein
MWVRVLLFCIVLSCLHALAQQEPSSAPAANSPSAPSATNAQAPSNVAKPKLDLTPGKDGRLSQEQMRELTRVVAENYRANYQRERDYTFVERDVENTIDGSGKTKSTEIKSYDVLDIYGEQVRRLVAKDDKPLDAKEAAKEEEKVQKIIDRHKNESEEERKRREERAAKDREDSRKFVGEVADTFSFSLLGTELVGDREAWVINGEPRPESELHNKDSKFLSKFHGRLWIDKDDFQLAKMDIEAIDTASVGWVLARIHKGTRVIFERTRMTDEIWLPKQLNYKLDARVALFKGYRMDAEQSYREYKKFRTSSKIVRVGDLPEQEQKQK